MFLLGLTLLARWSRDLLAVVTAFAIAHSVTRGLAVARLARPPAAWVEPAIALSVAWVGARCLSGRRGHGLPLAFRSRSGGNRIHASSREPEPPAPGFTRRSTHR
ncbi:MAG: HupE/UreJ family protein [Gammaproteobacteria bacterium]